MSKDEFTDICWFYDFKNCRCIHIGLQTCSCRYGFYVYNLCIIIIITIILTIIWILCYVYFWLYEFNICVYVYIYIYIYIYSQNCIDTVNCAWWLSVSCLCNHQRALGLMVASLVFILQSLVKLSYINALSLIFSTLYLYHHKLHYI